MYIGQKSLPTRSYVSVFDKYLFRPQSSMLRATEPFDTEYMLIAGETQYLQQYVSIAEQLESIRLQDAINDETGNTLFGDAHQQVHY